MIFEIADLDPKLKTWADLVSELQCAQLGSYFHEIWHSGTNKVTNLIKGLRNVKP